MPSVAQPLVELLQHIAQSDELALETFYKQTVHRVYGLALKIVTRPELAEEVVSDVYLQVWQQAKNFHTTRGQAMSWLLMICRSRALDKLRREKTAAIKYYQQQKTHQQEEELIVVEAPLTEIMSDEHADTLHTALKLLSHKQRQTLALAFYRGMSHQEISAYTGEPLGTIKSNIRRSQAVLRNALKRADLSLLEETGGLYGKA